jgi:hypothetical protein
MQFAYFTVNNSLTVTMRDESCQARKAYLVIEILALKRRGIPERANSRRPAGPLSLPTRRPGLRSRWRSLCGGASAGLLARESRNLDRHDIQQPRSRGLLPPSGLSGLGQNLPESPGVGSYREQGQVWPSAQWRCVKRTRAHQM